MILLIILGLIIVPPIGNGVGMVIAYDRQCRGEQKMTRFRGPMLEIYCD